MLSLRDVSGGYSQTTSAVSAISIDVPDGGFVSLLGPNGAGKTTIFRLISGVMAPRGGSIVFDGVDLLRQRPSERSHLGIAHVPEGRQVFPNLTVQENLEVGARANRHRSGDCDIAYQLFPMLADRRSQLAGSLSGGQQQMLAIGRALVSLPTLLMLDEPSMGLAPAVADTIFETILEIRRKMKLSVLLVEQRVGEALGSCDYSYVLEVGRIVLEGPPAEISSNKLLSQAYLGL